MDKQSLLLKKIASYELQRNEIDYEMAASLHELYVLCGNSADFIYVLKDYFKVHGKTLNMWLRTAKFYPKFTRKDWKMLGGRNAIQKLHYLNAANRRKVMQIAYDRVSERKRPLNAIGIQTIIRSLGLRSKTPGSGGWSKAEVHSKLLKCQNWLDILYRDYDLPRPPKDVKEAMQRTNLAAAMRRMEASA